MLDSAAARYLVFQLGGERFAVPLTDVHEVIEMPPMRPVPDAAPSVLGVATIAGQFVVVYDPRSILNVGGRIDGAALLFIHDGRRVALAVDDVFDPLAIAPEDIKAAPVAGAGGRGVTGVVRRGSDLIALVDTHALLDAAMHAHAEGGR